MASRKCMRLAAVAALAASTVMMSGATFAASTNAVAAGAHHPTGLLPGPVGDASEHVRSTVADVRNQIHRQS